MNTPDKPEPAASVTTPKRRPDRKRRKTATGVLVALGLNAALTIVSLLVLGHVFGWLAPGRDALPQTLGYGLPFLQFVLFGCLIDQVFTFFARRWAETQAEGRQPPRLGLQLGRVFIYFCVLAMTVSSVFDQSVTGLLAASGVIGLVMGFALRGMVSDLFFGIALHIDRNIVVGDWIDFTSRGRDFSGQLVDIHWRSVTLLDVHDNIMLVPNGEFASAVVINRSRPHPVTEYATHITLGSEYECGRVLCILDTVLSHLASEHVIQPDPPPAAHISQVEGGVVKYRLTYSTYPGRTAASETQSAVLRSALQFLRTAGVYIYPLYPNYTAPEKLPLDRPQSREVRLRVLAGVSLLRVLSPQALESLADGTEGRMCSPGEILVEAGQYIETMWVIAEGAFDVIAEKNGIAAPVAILWPGDWVGEMSLLIGEPRLVTIQARTASYVYAITKQVMHDVLEAEPELIATLAQIAGRRRKAREGEYRPPTPKQEQAKTKSTIARIREFFCIYT